MGIEVRSVSNRRDFNTFLQLPYTIYPTNKLQYIISPQQLSRQLSHVSPNHLQLLLTFDVGKPVARVAGMINPNHSEPDTALFGYFESTGNFATSKKLFSALKAWALKKGYHYLTGPVSYQTNDSIGMLVEGFSLTPQFTMPYNREYYPSLMEECGFKKHLDLLAYLWKRQMGIPQKLDQLVPKIRKQKDVLLRQLNLNYLPNEAQFLFDIHNQTMKKNWGGEHLSYREAYKYLSSYRTFADPELLLAVEVNGTPAGICLTLPKPVSKENQRRKSCRIAVLGVVPHFRQKGVAPLLMHETLLRLIRKGYEEAELSLILESNTMMNRIIRKGLSAEPAKRYRIYRQALENKD